RAGGRERARRAAAPDGSRRSWPPGWLSPHRPLCLAVLSGRGRTGPGARRPRRTGHTGEWRLPGGGAVRASRPGSPDARGGCRNRSRVAAGRLSRRASAARDASVTGGEGPVRAVLARAGGALALKVAGACAAFVMFAATARTLDAEAFGRLGIWFNAMCFLAVVALCGQETLILKVWPTGSGTCRRALVRFALRNTIAAALGLFLMALMVAIAAGHGPRA